VEPDFDGEGLRPGTRVGDYKLVRLLAVGGMAELYLARRTGTDGFEKVVALKRLLPRLTSDPDFVTMFLDEARLTAALRHPNIAQVHDSGRWEGNHYFAMEYVHGRDIRTILQVAKEKGRGLTLGNALEIVRGVASGLHHSHEQKGLDGKPLATVHRDVSPSNVMVTFDGDVKIVDFGIAKAAARSTKTQSGAVKGTVSYMSPEQCRGDDLDRRSDVFAIGILLFELTTGTRFVKHTHDYAAMHQLVHEDAPHPSSRRRDYPPELERIVLRALRRDRNERYASARDLQLDLEEFATEHKIRTSSLNLGQFMRDIFGDQAELHAPDRPSMELTPADHEASDPEDPVAPTTTTRNRSRIGIPGERKLAPRLLIGGIMAAALLAGAVVLLQPDETPPNMDAVIERNASSSPTTSPPRAEPVEQPTSSEPAPSSPPATSAPDAPPQASTPAIETSPPRPMPPARPVRGKVPGKKAEWDLDSPLPP